MKNINRDLPDDLNQLFQEWQSFPSKSLEGLASFGAQHPNLADEVHRPVLYAILSDLYGTDYLAGIRVSVNQFLKKLAEWPEFASLGLDPDELTRYCLEVYFHVMAQEPDIEDLCLAYPAARDFIRDFAEKNGAWLFPSQTSPEGERLVPGEKESILEDYQILELIGHGGQKDVYTVTQQSTGQTLALKVPSREDGRKDEFISEANIQARLSHQGIPVVFSLAFGPDVPTRLVERYIDGTSWANIFSGQTQEENIQILERTSRILASAHLEHHVIHGDLKPLNVMINPKYNEIYLVDWGMAIPLDRKPERLVPRGTMDYLPPEIANGEIGKVCMGTDVFMLGAVLYHILAGYAPYSRVFTSVGPFDAMIYALEGRWPALPETGKYGTIPQELREIVEKAMAYEPADRYHDAGQFADALAKYLKRAKLLDRYEKAKEYNATLLKRYQIAGLDHRERALLLADAIGNVNAFALIRRDLAETEKDSTEKSALLRDVFNSELASRQFLLEKTISMKDYAQATAQLETQRESAASYRESFGAGTSCEAFIQKADHEIQHGLYVQKRDRLMRWVTLVMIILVLALVSFGAYREAKKAEERAKWEKEERKAKAILLARQLGQVSEVAKAQGFGQGKLVIESLLEDIPDDIPNAWRQECTLHSSLLPEQCASGAEIIEAVSFSPDEKYFIGKTSDNYLTCWQTEDGQFVSREKIIAEIPGMDEAILCPNPCFRNREAPSPAASSEFLIMTSKGILVFWNHSGQTRESAGVDLVKENPDVFPDGDALSLGRPVFLSQKGSTTMVVGDQDGKIFFFSLPDGKLQRQVQAHEKGVNSLCLSADQKYLATSGNDGQYRYWETAGTKVEELKLPLSTEPHPQFGYCRRLDISPDGKLLAAGMENGEILVWDLLNKKEVVRMQEKANANTLALIIQRVYWLDNSRLLTICPNGHYGIWNLNKRDANGVPESMDLPVKDSLPMMGIRAGAVSPSRQKLLLSENNFKLSLFDLQTGEKELASEGLSRFRFQNISLPIAPIWHRGLGRIIVGGCDYDPIRLYDPATIRAEELEPLRDQYQPWVATGIEAASEGTRFAIAITPLDRQGKGVIQLYEGNPPVLKSEIKSSSNLKFPDSVISCALSPDGKLLAEMDCRNFEINIRDWETGSVLKTVEMDGVPLSFCFNSENRLITISRFQVPLGNVQTLNLARWKCDWNSEGEKPVKEEELRLSSMISAVTFARDGRSLALGFGDGKILLLDSQDFAKKKNLDFSEPLYSLQNNIAEILIMRKTDNILNARNCVTGIAWSSNDEFMMASFSSGKSVLVETESFSEVASCYCGDETYLPGDYRTIHPVFVGPDQLFTFSGKGGIYRWNWVPSPEKPDVLWENNGSRKILEFRDGMLACLEKYSKAENPFYILQGKEGIACIRQIADFESLGNGTFLLLKDDGTLMAINEKGEPAEMPGSLKALPDGEIETMQVSSDKRWIGVKMKEETIWYADLDSKEPNWVQVKVDSVKAMCFAPNRPELILLTPQLSVWNLEKQEFVRKSKTDFLSPLETDNIVSSRFSQLEKTHREKMKYWCFQVTASQSGQYVFNVIPGNAIGVWDRKRQEIIQIISPEVLSSALDRLFVLPLDRGFGEWENEDAFVVGGYDGTLHFYQFIPAERKFKNVYVVSQLQLADCMELPELVGDKSDKMFEKKTEEMFQLVKQQNYWIETLALSADGRTLYVGSIGNVYAYNMDEIRKNVAGLEAKWAKANFEDLTSLRFSLDSGIQSVNRVFLKKK